MNIRVALPDGNTISFTGQADSGAFCFVPSYGPPDAAQALRIVFPGHPGYLTTTLGARTIEAAEALCNTLNASLGFSEEEWLSIAARSMARDCPSPRPGCH